MLLLLMVVLLLLLELLLLLVNLLLLRCDIAEGGLAMAQACCALLLRFSQYMLWCRC